LHLPLNAVELFLGGLTPNVLWSVNFLPRPFDNIVFGRG
jgi:hypothetical protein